MKVAGLFECYAPSLLALRWKFSGADHKHRRIGIRTGTLHFVIHDALNQRKRPV